MFHLSDLIVFIYQVWVGNCMCVFPVISLLLMKQNVLSLNSTAGNESDAVTDLRMCYEPRIKRKGTAVFHPFSVCSGENTSEQLNSALTSYVTEKLSTKHTLPCSNEKSDSTGRNILLFTSLLKP